MVKIKRLKKAVTGRDGWMAEMAVEHPTKSGVRGTDRYNTLPNDSA